MNTRIMTDSTGEPFFIDNNAGPDKKDPMNVVDSEWVKSMFMVRDTDLETPDNTNRYWSTANLKFTDTRMGGNIGINSRPQFTRYADTRMQGRLQNRNEVTISDMSGNVGMGHYYSEAIDDNAQTVYLEFGVPEFNSLFTFFTRSIDYATSVVASSGRSPVAYTAGKVLGNIAMFVAFPIVSLAIWGIKTLADVLTNDGEFSYYYLKPAMHIYWNTVNTLVTQMATELGVLIPELMDGADTAERIGVPIKLDGEDLKFMRSAMPDILTENNYIDVFAIANRAQVLADRQMLLERELYNNDNSLAIDYVGYVRTAYTTVENKSPGSGFAAYLNSVLSLTGVYDYDDPVKKPTEETAPASTTASTTTTDKKLTIKNDDGTIAVTEEERSSLSEWTKSAGKYFDAAAKGGGRFAVFKVDYVGSVSESFSNSVTDIPAAGMIKSVAKKGREAKFSFAGGNIAGSMLADIGNAAKDVAAGALDSVSFGLSNIIPTLFGGGYIDIPKMWDDSSVSMPKLTFTMQLISPYGNTMSQIQNMYIPLAMILAGGLPLSTGKASYTSPLICNMFLKGVQNIKLGMITDITIARGTTNLGFNKQRRALGIDVTFSITDFSNIMSAPVSSNMFSVFDMSMGEGTLMSNYISVLASRDLKTMRYAIPKAKLKISRASMGVSALTSPAYWGSRTGDMFSGLLGGALADFAMPLQQQN